MPIIDADCHVIETERTWEYMAGPDKEFRPTAVATRGEGQAREFWLIDSRLQPRRDNVGRDTPEAAREGIDIEARLRHMDELDVDMQILYPTLFLRPITSRAEVDLAICRSYNRWLADIYAAGKRRLGWAMLPPLLSMDKALEEVRWAREHGACAIFMRGVEHDKRLCDPYFFPLYELASDLDMPIGVHSGNGSFGYHDLFAQEAGFCKFKQAVIGAFHSVVQAEMPERFPKLRMGFIEVSAQWIPHAIHDLRSRFRRKGKVLSDNVLSEWRLYVACQTDDDLPYVLQYSGNDSLLIGSDYGHADTSSELEALRNLKRQGKADPSAIDKILDANPRRFYGL